ncbi:unnamed protein product [Diplocarpon coronariae]
MAVPTRAAGLLHPAWDLVPSRVPRWKSTAWVWASTSRPRVHSTGTSTGELVVILGNRRDAGEPFFSASPLLSSPLLSSARDRSADGGMGWSCVRRVNACPQVPGTGSRARLRRCPGKGGGGKYATAFCAPAGVARGSTHIRRAREPARGRGPREKEVSHHEPAGSSGGFTCSGCMIRVPQTGHGAGRGHEADASPRRGASADEMRGYDDPLPTGAGFPTRNLTCELLCLLRGNADLRTPTGFCYLM